MSLCMHILCRHLSCTACLPLLVWTSEPVHLAEDQEPGFSRTLILLQVCVHMPLEAIARPEKLLSCSIGCLSLNSLLSKLHICCRHTFVMAALHAHASSRANCTSDT